MVVFDISTCNNAINFLCDFLNVSKSEINYYINNYCGVKIANEKFTKFILTESRTDIKELKLDEILFIIYHVTTRKNLESLKESLRIEGILNLQEALTRDTELKIFLNKNEIYIDVSEKLMKVQDKKVELNDFKVNYSDRIDNSLKKLYKKIYSDYQVNGFFSMRSCRNYCGEVQDRPEILYNLEDYLGKIKKSIAIQSKWENETQPFIIKYKAKLDEIDWSSIYDEKNQYEEVNKISLKKELISHALDIILNVKKYGETLEKRVMMNKDINVFYSDIIEVLTYRLPGADEYLIE